MFDVMPMALLLAQMCVAEIGFPEQPTECRVMWHVLDAKPGGLRERVLTYNSYFKSPKQRAARPYIQHLREDLSQPAQWPEDRLRWNAYVDRWKAVLASARRFLVQPGAHPCPRAQHYGGPIDGKHADDHVPAHWVRVNCGKTSQAYYRVGDPLPARVAAGGFD